MWRDRAGAGHAPANMDTGHLFHTLRMIWNNFMPPEAHIGRVIIYTWHHPTYTPEYMRTAAAHMLAELQQRRDLRRDWQDQLWQMRAYAIKMRLLP